MKKLTVILMLLAVAALAFRLPDTLEIGAPLPKGDLKMKDISGKEISLNEAKGTNGLLVMFTCNTCPYVKRNQERTQAICAYAQKHNIGVILINSNEAQRTSGDSFDAMKDYAGKQQYKWYYVVDKNSEIADAFAADRTPECYLFGKNSQLAYKGAIDDHPGNPAEVKDQYLKQAIDAMLAGKPIANNNTASVGCAIKRKM
ncbi:thioredoxin family protein [Chitinophaga horti]|uniref:Thioredoxin family protein n=1 Tax=Chitinophaga horti TaxID=2920382 RepID=A0ABY6IUN6_9BACT|nr:thioredoxin family protein [Chitinophaga horti]UYQ91084.1 thioredoxin family protein [Chitinophaga horti]